jgi:hypothetical protein
MPAYHISSCCFSDVFFCYCNSTFQRIGDLKDYYRKWVSEGIEKIIKEIVQESAQKPDLRILKWTFDSLSADHEQDQFFRGFLGFCNSTVVKNSHHVVECLVKHTRPDIFMKQWIGWQLLSVAQ